MEKINSSLNAFYKKCSLFIEKIKAFSIKSFFDIENKFKQPLFCFLAKSVLYYLLIIMGFAYLFQNCGKLCSSSVDINDFFDCFYFSIITFHTIGYGDIIPNDDLTKWFVIIESALSLVFVGVFVGYLMYHLQKRDLDKKRKPIINIARRNLFEIVNIFSFNFIPTKNISTIPLHNIFFGKIGVLTFDFEYESNTDIKDIIELDFERGIKGYFDMKRWEKEEDRSEHNIHYYENYYANLNKIEDFKNDLNNFLYSYSSYIEEELLNDVNDVLYEIGEYLYFYPKIDYPLDDKEQYQDAIDRISKIVKKALDLKAFLIKESKAAPSS